jgi:hypothetical protein
MKPKLREYLLKECIPEVYSYDIISKDTDKELEDYKILHHLGLYCAKHFWEPGGNEILKTIDSIYKSRDLFIQNAVENEFFTVLTLGLGMDKLLDIIKTIPTDLQTVYIKVLLEITKESGV